MSMTDPIADMLTRIRNAIMASYNSVDIPSSGLKIDIAKVLKTEGFIRNYKIVADRKQGILRIFLGIFPGFSILSSGAGHGQKNDVPGDAVVQIFAMI